MFDKILIANRGEIACRIIKTCKRLQIKTVAVYSDIDKGALFTQLADEAYPIGEAESQKGYLNIDTIIDVAKRSNADAIHPGYGFLSENTEFVKRCEKEKIQFIGPNTHAIELMASKSRAKAAMQKAGIPTIPGYHGDAQDEKTLLKEAKKIGFPVLLKAALGGGGKGMRIVEREKDFIEQLIGAKREALKSFADDTMLIEKYLAKPRHIEVQVFADNHGNVVHVFERDCSIQRRHQKIIEEAPAIGLTDKLKAAMFQAAINATKAVNYRGAGTIEFLVEDDAFYFMEMNTRLQVEHGVTEEITGLDLVQWQIIVASNGTLPLSQKEIFSHGYAIEVRIYAEDPDNDFLPQSGQLGTVSFPDASRHCRIDTGIQSFDHISIYYDPMIAKIISIGETRQAAIYHANQALMQTRLPGIHTNVNFLSRIFNTKAFSHSIASTNFLETEILHPGLSLEHAAIYALLYERLSQSTNRSPWLVDDGFAVNQPALVTRQYCHNNTVLTTTIKPLGDTRYQVSVNDTSITLAATLKDNTLNVEHDGLCDRIYIEKSDHGVDVITNKGQLGLSDYVPSFDSDTDIEGQLTSPMPGSVVAILCDVKEQIDKGQTLMVIEAMKMEHSIVSPSAAVVKNIHFTVGARVNEGDKLLELEEL